MGGTGASGLRANALTFRGVVYGILYPSVLVPTHSADAAEGRASATIMVVSTRIAITTEDGFRGSSPTFYKPFFRTRTWNLTAPCCWRLEW